MRETQVFVRPCLVAIQQIPCRARVDPSVGLYSIFCVRQQQSSSYFAITFENYYFAGGFIMARGEFNKLGNQMKHFLKKEILKTKMTAIEF
jgi:hypothetical protein